MTGGLFHWRIEDRGGDPVGEATFSNPLILGRDRGILKARNGVVWAELELRPRSFFSSLWEGRLALSDRGVEWELPAVALAAIRIAWKQSR